MSEQSYTAGIYTLGCKVNQYESEAIAEELRRSGVEILPPTEVCDAYVINTCTVTAESDRKCRQFIRRAIGRNPDAFVAVTGCLAQTDATSIAAIEGVDAVIGNTEKMGAAREILALLRQGKKPLTPRISVGDVRRAPFEPMSITAFARTRAYIKIEDGCESRCTYCIIPDARGSIRSKNPDEVIREVTELTAGGCAEVVLTGIETASYGKDLGNVDLADLLLRVDAIEGIGRVRLGSLDPSLIKPPFVERIRALPSLAHHFHLSLQSGSSAVLARMKRKYNASQAMNAIRLLREALTGVQLTTDVIVGFPGETEEELEETRAFLREARFLTVHLFPYSKRKGTPAAVMAGQIPEAVKRERLHRLEAEVAQIRGELLREAIDRAPVTEVLFETYRDGVAYGHTAEFIEVALPSPVPLHGQLVRVRLTHTDGTLCFAVRA